MTEPDLRDPPPPPEERPKLTMTTARRAELFCITCGRSWDDHSPECSRHPFGEDGRGRGDQSMLRAQIPDDIASCLRCRDIVVLRRSKQGGCHLHNPQPYEWTLINRVLGRHWQGRQMPGGSYHERCKPFRWTSLLESSS